MLKKDTLSAASAKINTKKPTKTNNKFDIGFYWFLTPLFLHFFSFNLPISSADLSEKTTLHCAFSMRNGVIFIV